MKTKKCFKLALNMVLHSKLRSWLTIIGIVIGVASVIAIVSIGEGLQNQVSGELGSLGAEIITITPGFSQAGGFGGGGDTANAQAKLGRNDVQALKGIPDIELIDVNIQGRGEVYYLGESAHLGIRGVDQKVWHQITQEKILEGRLLGPSDQNVVVIGYTLAKEYFDEQIGINKIITIDDRAFRVVGILEEGNGFAGGGNTVYMPLQSAYELLQEDVSRDEYHSITLKVHEGTDVDLAVEKIEKKLMIVRHVSDDDRDFTVVSMKQIQEQISSITGMITLFLGAIAGVALIVGAVGIANTMFTSVLEKTKEIGIMKAIGARNKDILLIFLFNSGLMGLVGGLIGVAFGFLISKAIPFMLPASDGVRMMTSVSVEIVLLALGVSIAIGMIAGMIPAYSGSKLRPVDALRYE